MQVFETLAGASVAENKRDVNDHPRFLLDCVFCCALISKRMSTTMMFFFCICDSSIWSFVAHQPFSGHVLI